MVNEALQALSNMLSANEILTGAPISIAGQSTSAQQIKVNAEQGRVAEDRVGQELLGEGNKVLGSRVSVRTSEGRRVVDPHREPRHFSCHMPSVCSPRIHRAPHWVWQEGIRIEAEIMLNSFVDLKAESLK